MPRKRKEQTCEGLLFFVGRKMLRFAKRDMSPGGDAIFRLWRSDMLRGAKRDMSPSGDAIFCLRQSDMLRGAKRDMFSLCENVGKRRDASLHEARYVTEW